MEKNEANRILAVVLSILIIAFLGIFVFKETAITGVVIYEEEIKILNWTFDDSNDFSYDNSLVEISGGDAKLASTTAYIYWNTSIEADYSVTSALYDPSDKTDKVNSMDNKKHEVKEDRSFEIFFSNELSDGDVVSLYIKDGDETDIYLCRTGTVCSTPDYGSVSYDEEEGWYNLTISGLQNPTKIIGIVAQDEKVEFDYVTSTKGNITKALYDPSDKTSKIQSKDDDKFEVNKNKLFNIIFDNKVDNGDIISFYITNGNQGDVYLCDYGDDCSTPGYGLVNFNGNEGWFNITITGLSSPKDTFNINPDKDMKFDYIKAIHIDLTQHTSTNISYPESASIGTKDISIAGLASFLNFHRNELLNDQNIDYSYSIDSGSSWNPIPSNNNLSDVPVSSGKIRIKADIVANGTETPIIYDFSVSYLTQICNENWNVTYDACLSNNTQLKYYIDKNECGATSDLPSDNGTYESCDYCSPSWECISYGGCLLTNEKVCKEVNDQNNCFNATGMESDKYNLNYNEFNQSCIYDKKGSNYQNLSISLMANERTIINATNSTDTILEVVLNENADNKLISITKHNENLKNTSPESAALGKYLDIIADENILENITYVKIKIYYTDEEIDNANLNEETLKIHYFNDTSNQWQILNSTVNTTGNYVEVTIDHLSTFGIFGEEKATQSSESSGSTSGGSGGGKTRIIKKTEETTDQKATEKGIKEKAEKKEEKIEMEGEKECNYQISVSMPEHVSFVEYDLIEGIISNIGNCEIKNINIDASPELSGIIDIENEKIENIMVNESVEFLLLRKLENRTNLLIQGFNIKIPKKNIKTYSGSLIFGAIIQEEVAFEERINVKVDLLEEPSIMEIIGSKISILLIAFLLFIVIFFVIYLKFYQNKIKNFH